MKKLLFTLSLILSSLVCLSQLGLSFYPSFDKLPKLGIRSQIEYSDFIFSSKGGVESLVLKDLYANKYKAFISLDGNIYYIIHKFNDFMVYLGPGLESYLSFINIDVNNTLTINKMLLKLTGGLEAFPFNDSPISFILELNSRLYITAGITFYLIKL